MDRLTVRKKLLVSSIVVLRLLITAGLVFVLAPIMGNGDADLKVKAIYVWWHGHTLLESASERDRFFAVAEQENINTVYFHINVDSSNFFEPGWSGVANGYRDFIEDAQAERVEVHALLSGSVSVFANPSEHKLYIEAILKYNIENPGYTFSGIKWDIEPVNGQAEAFAEYMRQAKSYAYNGQTIISQKLTLSAYLDAPYHLGDGARELYREFDMIVLNTYRDSVGAVIAAARDGPRICEEEGIQFLIGVETDELPTSGNRKTLYEEGRDAYHAIEAGIDTYFSNNYSQFAGQYLHHYEKGVSWWYMITATNLPQGQYQAGQQVPVTVTLRRSDSHPAAPVGVRVRIRDEVGNTYEVSKIVVLSGLETRHVTLQWTVPSSAVSGNYDIEVNTWDIDIGSRDSILYEVDFGGDKAAMEAIDLAELTAMSDLSGMRDPFVPLDNTGWSEDSFRVV